MDRKQIIFLVSDAAAPYYSSGRHQRLPLTGRNFLGRGGVPVRAALLHFFIGPGKFPRPLSRTASRGQPINDIINYRAGEVRLSPQERHFPSPRVPGPDLEVPSLRRCRRDPIPSSNDFLCVRVWCGHGHCSGHNVSTSFHHLSVRAKIQ